MTRSCGRELLSKASELNGLPRLSRASAPKTRICPFYYFMTFTNSSDINRGLSGENQLRAIANKSPGHERNISNQTPSVSILAWQVYPDSCSYTYDCSQPPNCERHGKPKNIEPFKELKVIRVVLVYDFIIGPMLVAKFPCLLSTVHLGVH